MRQAQGIGNSIPAPLTLQDAASRRFQLGIITVDYQQVLLAKPLFQPMPHAMGQRHGDVVNCSRGL